MKVSVDNEKALQAEKERGRRWIAARSGGAAAAAAVLVGNRLVGRCCLGIKCTYVVASRHEPER